MPFFPLKRYLRRSFAMDLGTANTLIALEDEGIVLNEPTAVAMDRGGEVVERGLGAKRLLGKAPKGVRALRPMADGVIADFEAMSALIREFLSEVLRPRGILPPRAVVSVPSKASQLEKRAVLEAVWTAGAKEVFLLEEAMAAAIGLGLEVHGPSPCLVVDIGGGTTEAAAIAEGAFLASECWRVGGDELDQAIHDLLMESHGIEIGVLSAEELKWRAGSAAPHPEVDGRSFEVAGTRLRDRLPARAEVAGEEVREALLPVLRGLARGLRAFFEALPPEALDVARRDGIRLTGGTSLLRRLPEFLTEALGLPVIPGERPLEAVVLGASRAAGEIDLYRSVFTN